MRAEEGNEQGRGEGKEQGRGGAASVPLPAAGAPRIGPQGRGALHKDGGHLSLLLPPLDQKELEIKILGSQTVLWPGLH